MHAVLTDPDDLCRLLGIPFTPEQLDAVLAPLSPGVIVAGAGSGKTTVMTARVVWLVGTGAVRPDQVLGLTFTNKAAGELAQRVRKAIGQLRGGEIPADEDAGEPTVSTYHAFAGRLLQEHGLRIGLEPSARLLADATRYQLAARAARTARGPFPTLTGRLPDVVASVLHLGGELAEHLVFPERLQEWDRAFVADVEAAAKPSAAARKAAEAARNRLDLTRLVDAYGHAKSSRDLLDFGDQIAYAARIAGERPEVGEILRDTYRVVLLDEYQDTSVAQRVLLQGLFGHGHPVTAVGDPCQAIYGWRGASVANIHDFPVHFPGRDGTPAARYALSENRRSGGRILAFANDLSAPLRTPESGVEALRPGPGAEHEGWAVAALLPTHGSEIDWLADRIKTAIDTVLNKNGDPITPGDVAVLARTAADFADIHAALVRRDIPVEVVGLSGLLHLPEVADLVAVCEVLDDPTANSALVRLLAGPRWRIGPRDLALLGRRAAELVRVDRAGADDADARLEEAVAGIDPTEVVSLSDALADPGEEYAFSAEARRRFARVATEIRDLRRHLGEPLMDLLHRVLAGTGLEVELSASPGALAARRRETLHAFLDVAAGFADLDGDPSLTAFLAFLRTAAEHDKGLDGSLPTAGDSVKVLTAHKSKGLEWEVVAVPGLIEGVFPSVRTQSKWITNGKALPHPLRGDAAALAVLPDLTPKGFKAFDASMREHQATEELRLGYVTFTRPKQLLIASGHWWGPTQKKRRGPSEFLSRLREHCLAGNGTVEVWTPEPAEPVNPYLANTVEHAWPLPLDATALMERRRAADAVLAELARREAARRVDHAVQHPSVEAETGPGRDPEPGRDAGFGRAPESGAGAGHGSEHTSEHEHGFAPESEPEPQPERESGSGFGPADDEQVPVEVYDAHVPADPEQDAPPPEDDFGPPDHEQPVPEHDDAREHEDPRGHSAEVRGPSDEVRAGHPPVEGPAAGAAVEPTPDELALIESWDRDLVRLAEELRRGRSGVREVPLPPTLSASQMLRLSNDPDGLARELARPMPRPPAPAARRGTRFHAWVESLFGERPLLEPDDLPGAADEEITDEADLLALQEAFLRTPYAQRAPYRVEAPFQLFLGGRIVRGRIDAVYREGEGFEVVDWKTNRVQNADPLQLAVYRLAWAEYADVPIEDVSAAFLYVRTGELVRPRGLPGRDELEQLFTEADESGPDQGP
ncbi:ATP-dependent helicase [Embleya scabrispora]|uniref:ATP-dependent helicase n=1 Tax=Embleya scabrispora TaxID=159449 RepID=UPI00037C01B7|nr:ATP-dependent DNA helicase [Embleya scabrispora]MYS79300.1 UvrD-helicase domain-containing protein [Streptomyces sp. SID5474]